tara:strand:+ start:304 stop:435 length:132 start_codon:yes stop_codon:yes gene_type:complete
MNPKTSYRNKILCPWLWEEYRQKELAKAITKKRNAKKSNPNQL